MAIGAIFRQKGMKRTFIALLNDFIETNNKKVLEQPQRFMSLFLDYTQNEYRAETQIFSHFLSSKYAQELKGNNDVDIPFLKSLSERYQKNCLSDKKICDMAVFSYARFLGLIDQRALEAELSAKKSIDIEIPEQSDINKNKHEKNNIRLVR
jgi:hypothetical protein